MEDCHRVKIGVYYQLATFRELLISTEKKLIEAEVFFGHGYESAHDEAVALVLCAAGLNPLETHADILDTSYSEDVESRLASFISQRCIDRRPCAYITGEAYLDKLYFKCDERALIPRSPLAAVVAKSFRPWLCNPCPELIVDVCCGSGSLGLLTATYFPDADVILSDLDSDAIRLAAENIVHQKAQLRVKAVLANLLTAMKDESVDVIIANPPYVSSSEFNQLPEEYAHEPRIALESSDQGTAIIRRLLEQAARVLKPKGLLLFEVGHSRMEFERRFPTLSPVWLWLDLEVDGIGVTHKEELLVFEPESTS